MSDLGRNPVWNDISKDEKAATSGLLGPEFSYADNVPGPGSLGIGSDGSFSQLGRNAKGVAEYVKILISGDPPLGNRFFVNTGGTCVAKDGSTQSRSNYINNMASGEAILPSSMKELGASFNGLIPGVVDDIGGLNPIHLFRSMMSDGTPQCGCYKCEVSSGNPYAFLTTELSPDFNDSLCKEVDISNCIPPTTESFTVGSDVPAIPTIVALLGFLFIVFSAK
jgi:hypothetical protein